MMNRITICLALILFSAALAISQPMQYSLNNAPGEYNGTMLTTTCGGNVPIPDGQAIIYIYQDADGNGPSANDQLAPLCAHPPDCYDGPPGTFNFNSFPINGEEILGQAGYFASTSYLTSSGAMPSGQARFYLKVMYPLVCPRIVWISDVKTGMPGGVGDWFFAAWDCPVYLPPPCNPTTEVHFYPNPISPLNHPVCATLCGGHTTLVMIGPDAQEGNIPVLNVVPGCVFECSTSDPFTYDPNHWVWTTVNGEHYYINTIALNPSSDPCYEVRGCVTVTYDWFLPVELGTVTFTPLNSQVRVNWSTRSESNLERFDILRDGHSVGSRQATNSATGAAYEFIDESLQNGRTYHYELLVVNLDHSTERVAQSDVTPQDGIGVVSEFALYQNYPNPFNPTTTISFDLAETGNISLKVFNLIGQPVAELVKGSLAAGHHSITFDAAPLPSGVYIYQLKAGGFHSQKKMLLMK